MEAMGFHQQAQGSHEITLPENVCEVRRNAQNSSLLHHSYWNGQEKLYCSPLNHPYKLITHCTTHLKTSDSLYSPCTIYFSPSFYRDCAKRRGNHYISKWPTLIWEMLFQASKKARLSLLNSAKYGSSNHYRPGSGWKSRLRPYAYAQRHHCVTDRQCF